MSIRPILARLAGAAALAVVCLNTVPASAILMLTLERVDDNTAILTGTGDMIDRSQSIFLDGASIDSGNVGVDAISGDFAIGGHAAYQAYILSSGLAVNLDASAFPGDMVTGTGATIDLDIETWAAVGTTGNVYTSDGGDPLGIYEIVAPLRSIPEPASFALMGIGLAGMAAVRRRRR